MMFRWDLGFLDVNYVGKGLKSLDVEETRSWGFSLLLSLIPSQSMDARGDDVPEVVLNRHGNSLACTRNQSFLLQTNSFNPFTLRAICLMPILGQ